MARKIRAILWIGLVAGTLDITENLVFNHFRGISRRRVFQYIASGLIGMKSFQNGWNSVALGVAIHYAIALTWTGIFLVAALKFPTITRRPVLTIASRINAALALIFCIGLPISLLMRKVETYGTQSRQSKVTSDR